MTNEEKFRKGIVVYKNEENDYVCAAGAGFDDDSLCGRFIF